jgi:tripartite-type tricarboxylate transporter receptor subunit TctC
MSNIKSHPPMGKSLGILAGLSAALAVFTAMAVLAADTYPSKTVRLIIPFAPGGSNDIIGRMIASKLSESLGKQVIPVNQVGSGGLLGMEAAAQSQPDGYTLLIITPTYCIVRSSYSELPFDPQKSFVPVAKLGAGPGVLVAFPGLPVKSVKELIALAKGKPGKLVTSAAGVGSYQHVAGALFKVLADIDMVTVQFKGGGPAIIDTMGGHSQIHFGTLPTTMPYIKSGKLRALGVGALKRTAMLPDVPTIAEAGVPGYDASMWWGILAPAGTPQAIVDRLNKEIKAIIPLEETHKLFLAQGADVDFLGPAEFGTFIESEAAKWEKVVKKANIKMD